MEIKSKRHRETTTWYAHEFRWKRDKYSGFGFDCDKDGNMTNTNPAAIENYNACISGEYDVVDNGVQERLSSWMEPAIGICDKCGKEVRLEGGYCGAVECECGEWYNLFGQAILPPNQWQEPLEPEDYY